MLNLDHQAKMRFCIQIHRHLVLQFPEFLVRDFDQLASYSKTPCQSELLKFQFSYWQRYCSLVDHSADAIHLDVVDSSLHTRASKTFHLVWDY